MRYILFIFLFFYSNLVFTKSQDSPDLSVANRNAIEWNDWIINLKKNYEKKKKFKKNTLKYLDNLKLNKKVIDLDRKQPEFTINFNQYLKRNINDKKKNELKKKFVENKLLLKKIEKKYQVDGKVIMALWAIESSFGKYTGKFDIIRSLASLAFDGRRKDFFLKELEHALRIIDDGHIPKNQFLGSWAGAFGQTQFMPSTFHRYAIDFDGNNKINLFEKQDALASGANYLNLAGWDNKLYWGEKIKIELNNDLRNLSDRKKFKNLKYWENYGIILKNKYNEDDLLRLIIPDSDDNQCYLVTKNFDVILDWNRSNYFALTVFLLSNEID